MTKRLLQWKWPRGGTGRTKGWRRMMRNHSQRRTSVKEAKSYLGMMMEVLSEDKVSGLQADQDSPLWTMCWSTWRSWERIAGIKKQWIIGSGMEWSKRLKLYKSEMMIGSKLVGGKLLASCDTGPKLYYSFYYVYYF